MTLADLSVDPYPVLRRLQESEPVSWVPEVNMWFVTRRADVLSILTDYETFTVDSPESVIRDMFGRHMMTIDGPEQIRQKRRCTPPFKPKALLEALSESVERRVNALVDDIQSKRQAELRLTLAKPLAIHTVMEVLGLPTQEGEHVRVWYDCFAKALANFSGDAEVRHRGREAASQFAELVRSIVRERKTTGDSSLLSLLVRDDDRLTNEEIVSNTLIIMFGGIETTEAMICNAIWALLRHPEQLARVIENPTLVRRAIDESLRWEPAVQSCTRHATKDVVMRGVKIAQGQVVQSMLGAANRDPEHFSDPDVFDIDRPNAKDHLSFGSGRHFCLGAPLAYLEAETALRCLFARLRNLRLDRERPNAPRGHEFRKPPELWVVCG